MPIYEYHCPECRKRVSLFVRHMGKADTPTCPRCGGQKLERLMSRFARVRSEDDRLDAMTDPNTFGDLDENDPASVARWAKKMGKEMGEDLGEDFDQMVDEATEEEARGGRAVGEGRAAGKEVDEDL